MVVLWNSVKYANGSDVDNEATELYIDNQQRLFLAKNDERHDRMVFEKMTTSNFFV